MKEVNIEYDGCRPIIDWKPMLGDFIVHHGWFFWHWYGYVSGMNKNNHTLQVFKAGIPLTLFTMHPHAIPKNTIEISTHKITGSRWGAYCIQRLEKNRIVWYA